MQLNLDLRITNIRTLSHGFPHIHLITPILLNSPIPNVPSFPLLFPSPPLIYHIPFLIPSTSISSLPLSYLARFHSHFPSYHFPEAPPICPLRPFPSFFPLALSPFFISYHSPVLSLLIFLFPFLIFIGFIPRRFSKFPF